MKMNALLLDENKQLNLQPVDRPAPQRGEVRVKVKAAALNHRDLWIQKGMYPGMQLPCILGADGAGVVDATGKGVAKEWMGREVVIYPAMDWGDDDYVPQKSFRVLGMPDPGTFAEYICVPAENVLPKPAHLSWHEAAALPLTFLTAFRGITEASGDIHTDEKILITGIGGGVATAGLTLTALNNDVYVTSSSSEKIAAAVEMGAEGGVNYRDADWTHQLKQLSGGIDLVLDGSPAANLDDYLHFLNPGARVVYYGATGSLQTRFSLPKFFLRYIQLTGSTMGSPDDFSTMLEMVSDCKLRPVVSLVHAFREFEKAFAALRGGEQTGKVVLEL